MIRFQLSVAMLLSLTFLCSANADEQWMHYPPPADMPNGKKVVLIAAGWEYGDPRSKVPKRKDVKESWARLKVEMAEIEAKGHIVEIPGEIPDLSQRNA